MSIYPNAIDGFEQLPLAVDGVTPVNAASVNSLRLAILAIETELGILPSGDSATVALRLDDIDSIDNRVAQLEAQVSLLEDQLGSNPAGSFATVEERLDFIQASTTAPLTLVTDSNLVVGNLVKVNSSGRAELVSATDLDPNNTRVIGSAFANYSVGETAEISSIPGRLIAVKFASAPSAINNGSPVYLSGVAGEATLIPPNSSGSSVFLLGILQGADGVDDTPNIVFQPTLEAYLS